MKLLQICAICILLALLVFRVVEGKGKEKKPFQCYQCRSDQDKKGCDDEGVISKKFLKPCIPAEGKPKDEADEGRKRRQVPPGNATKEMKWKCRKITQTLYVTDPKETTIFRECAAEFVKEDGCNKTTNKLFFLSVCDCGQTGCNRTARMPRAVRILLAIELTLTFGAFVAMLNFI